MGKKTLEWERLDIEVRGQIKGECYWITWSQHRGKAAFDKEEGEFTL